MCCFLFLTRKCVFFSRSVVSPDDSVSGSDADAKRCCVLPIVWCCLMKSRGFKEVAVCCFLTLTRECVVFGQLASRSVLISAASVLFPNADEESFVFGQLASRDARVLILEREVSVLKAKVRFREKREHLTRF